MFHINQKPFLFGSGSVEKNGTTAIFSKTPMLMALIRVDPISLCQLYWVPQIAYDAWQGSRLDLAGRDYGCEAEGSRWV